MLQLQPWKGLVRVVPKDASEQESRAVRWHQSGLEQILGCPRQWFLEHVVRVESPAKLSTVAGTSYHAAVEAHERARMAGLDGLSLEQMETVALTALAAELVGADPLALAGVQVSTSKTRAAVEGLPPVLSGVAALEYQTVSCVRSFWLPGEDGLSIRDLLLPLTPLGVEVFGAATLIDGARELGGTVDGLYLNPATGQVIVIDHKTAGRLADWKRSGKGLAQATHYALLAYGDETLSSLSSLLPTRTYLPEVWFVVAARIEPARPSTPRSLTVVMQPTGRDLMAFGDRVRAAEQVLVEQVFPADPAYTWCNFCQFRDRCVGGTGELLAPAGVLLETAGLPAL